MIKEAIIHINCMWDEEAGVWIATSPDVKGLVLEDGSLDRLMYRVTEAIPELVELNNHYHHSSEPVVFQLFPRERV